MIKGRNYLLTSEFRHLIKGIFPLLQFPASCPSSTFPHDSKSQGKDTAPKYCSRQDSNEGVVKISTNTLWPQGTI